MRGSWYGSGRRRVGRWPAVAVGGLAIALLGGCGGAGNGRTTPESPEPTPTETAAPAAARAHTPPSDDRWTIEEVAVEGGSLVAEQIDLRTGRHEGFDRVVLTFAETIPGYRIRWVDGPVTECGSGREVPVGGAALAVDLIGAVAHRDGEPTVTERDRSPDLPTVRRVRLVCDFEGRVEWIVEAPEQQPFRVLELSRPSRLVVDLLQ